MEFRHRSGRWIWLLPEIVFPVVTNHTRGTTVKNCIVWTTQSAQNHCDNKTKQNCYLANCMWSRDCVIMWSRDRVMHTNLSSCLNLKHHRPVFHASYSSSQFSISFVYNPCYVVKTSCLKLLFYWKCISLKLVVNN